MTQFHQFKTTTESPSIIHPLLHDEHVVDWMWATSEWALYLNDPIALDKQFDEQYAIWAETSHPFTPQDATQDIAF